MELVATCHYDDIIRYGRWCGNLPDDTACALLPWRRGYQTVTFRGVQESLIEIRGDIEVAKKVLGEVLGRYYSLISARELKLVDSMPGKESPEVARLLLAKYRSLGILRHLVLTEGIPAKLAPRKAGFMPLTPTPPEKLLASNKRMSVRGGRGSFAPTYVVPLYDRVGNTYGFVRKDSCGGWTRTEFAPMYVVARTGSAKPVFRVFWTTGDTDFALKPVGKTVCEDKVLGLIQVHFTKCLLNHVDVADMLDAEVVKVVATKFSNEEIIQEIDRRRADCRREAHFKFDGKELELVLKLMGKKNEAND